MKQFTNDTNSEVLVWGKSHTMMPHILLPKESIKTEDKYDIFVKTPKKLRIVQRVKSRKNSERLGKIGKK